MLRALTIGGNELIDTARKSLAQVRHLVIDIDIFHRRSHGCLGESAKRETLTKRRKGIRDKRETGKGGGGVTLFGGLRTYNANLPADAAWQAGARRAPHPVSLI